MLIGADMSTYIPIELLTYDVHTFCTRTNSKCLQKYIILVLTFWLWNWKKWRIQDFLNGVHQTQKRGCQPIIGPRGAPLAIPLPRRWKFTWKCVDHLDCWAHSILTSINVFKFYSYVISVTNVILFFFPSLDMNPFWKPAFIITFIIPSYLDSTTTHLNMN